jgi:hypothetical protein
MVLAEPSLKMETSTEATFIRVGCKVLAFLPIRRPTCGYLPTSRTTKSLNNFKKAQALYLTTTLFSRSIKRAWI